MKILFMGTPDFAVPTLSALYDSGEEIVGVVTKPDQPKGRGYTLTPPPVKVWAEEHSLPVFQPTSMKDGEFLRQMAELNITPDVAVVVAYGKILPAEVLTFPTHGCINVHGSLLPKYRGASPMQRAIMDGERISGITTMLMDEGMDTGDMLGRVTVEIGENDDFEVFHDKMAEAGAELLLKTVAELKAGTLKREPQNHSAATFTKKIEKEELHIDFSRSARELHNLIRATSPFPLSYTRLPDGRLLKLVESRVSDEEVSSEAAPGEIISLSDGRITVKCGEGALAITKLLPEGKKRMDAEVFLRGSRLSVGDMLG